MLDGANDGASEEAPDKDANDDAREGNDDASEEASDKDANDDAREGNDAREPASDKDPNDDNDAAEPASDKDANDVYTLGGNDDDDKDDPYDGSVLGGTNLDRPRSPTGGTPKVPLPNLCTCCSNRAILDESKPTRSRCWEAK